MHMSNAAFGTGFKNLLCLQYREGKEKMSSEINTVMAEMAVNIQDKIHGWFDDLQKDAHKGISFNSWNMVHLQINNLIESLSKGEPVKLQLLEINTKMAMRSLELWWGPCIVKFFWDILTSDEDREYWLIVCYLEFIFYEFFKRLMTMKSSIDDMMLDEMEKKINSCL